MKTKKKKQIRLTPAVLKEAIDNLEWIAAMSYKRDRIESELDQAEAIRRVIEMKNVHPSEKNHRDIVRGILDESEADMLVAYRALRGKK